MHGNVDLMLWLIYGGMAVLGLGAIALLFGLLFLIRKWWKKPEPPHVD